MEKKKRRWSETRAEALRTIISKRAGERVEGRLDESGELSDPQCWRFRLEERRNSVKAISGWRHLWLGWSTWLAGHAMHRV
jgi:hypothetical protein